MSHSYHGYAILQHDNNCIYKTVDPRISIKSLRVIFPEACFVFRAATNLEIPRSLLRGGSLPIERKYVCQNSLTLDYRKQICKSVFLRKY